MELQCRGCAGCCLDWRPLVADGGPVGADGTPAGADGAAASDDSAGEGDHDGSQRGPYPSLDGAYNLVPLERDEVRDFVDAGYGDVLTPRLWAAGADDPHVEIGGHRVAAIAGRPAFFVGLRKAPKPVAPFGRERAAWLSTCTFLDPTTLQCRIHEDALYPAECGAYPAHNVALDQETECERVEAATGDDRLLSTADADAVADADGLLLGPQAVGGKVFCHPRPAAIEGAVDRIATGETTRDDRAEFVAVAAASSPGTLAISDPHYESAREETLAASSWAGEAIDDWTARAGELEPGAGGGESDGGDVAAPDPALAVVVEDERGAPPTPGWDGG